MTRRRVAALSVGLTVALTLAACAGSATASAATAAANGRFRATSSTPGTLTYCTAGRVALTMDVFPPMTGTPRPSPVAIWVHGGGWELGDAGPPGVPDPVEQMLQARGFFVASINYRLAPKFRWPAQLEDTKCAVRFLRAHASSLGINPRRIGAWGSSAGGHLVSMLGTAGPSAGYDVGQYRGQSSAVQAVVDEWGPADLAARDWRPPMNDIIKTVFGVAPGRPSAALAHASPVSFLRGGDPPFLIIQGVQDVIVPASQSQELDRRLQAVRVPASLVLVQNAGHELAPAGIGMPMPSVAQVDEMIVDFFSRQLQR